MNSEAYHPPGPRPRALIVGRQIESRPWVNRLVESMPRSRLDFRFSASLQSVPRPLDYDLLAIDLFKINEEPNRAFLKSIFYRSNQPGVHTAIFNFPDFAPGPWEALLKKSDLITAASPRALFTLLDHGLRAVIPGTDDAGEALGEELCLALFAAMVGRATEPRPTVSVVIPIHNADPGYLTEAIQSVFAQTDPDWELVLVDNGNPKLTRPVLRNFHDPRVSYFGDLGHRGIAMGRNVGAMLARGRIIAVLDHDDVCAPERVAAIKAALADPDAILYSDVIQLFPGGGQELTRLKLFTEEEMLRDCNIYHPTVAYPWRLAAQIPYDPRFEPADDYRFYLAALAAGKKLVHLAKPLLSYRRHAVQYSELAKERLAAVSKAVRIEARYLRAGRDPLDRESRYDPLLLNYLGHGLDGPALELVRLGYGARRSAEFTRVLLDPDLTGAGPEEVARAMTVALENVCASGDDGTWAAWLVNRRHGPAAAAALIDAGLKARIMPDEAAIDMGELHFRMGDPKTAYSIVGQTVTMDPNLALGWVHKVMLERWLARMGTHGPQPPPVSADRPLEKKLSVIVAAPDSNSGRLAAETIASIERGGLASIEAIQVGPEEIEVIALPGKFIAKRDPTRAADLAASFNAGAASASGEYLCFCQAGEIFEDGYFAAALDAVSRLGATASASLSQVTVGEAQLGEKLVGLSGLMRDERSFLMGLIIGRDALRKLGGFIEGLGPAAGWEFLIRLFKTLPVIQPGQLAGRSPRAPVISPAHRLEDAIKGDDFELGQLVKYIHAPLRYMELRCSAMPEAVLAERLIALARIAQAPQLLAHLDPWEFFAEHNDPPHLLYRIAQTAIAADLRELARNALNEAIRQRPLEPKLWLKRFSV